MEGFKRRLINLLREDARFSVKELAGMTASTEKDVRAAIEQLEKEGVILKYTAIIDEQRLLDDHVEALIEVKVTPRGASGFDALAEEIAALPQVKSVFLMSGAYDLAVFVKGKSLREAAMFVSEKLSCMESVLSTATHFILKKYKIEGVTAGDSGSNRLAVQP